MRERLLSRSLANQDPWVTYRLSHEYIRSGRYADGWALFESRLGIDDHPFRSMPGIAWDGRTPVGDRGLFLWEEQGFGDTILMLRYVPILARRGIRIVVGVRSPLRRLAATVEGVSRIVGNDGEYEAEYHASLLSLPFLLNTRLATVPSHAPYLTVPPDAETAWHERLPTNGRRRIGLVTSGNASMKADADRSVPLELLTPLFSGIDADFHLLDKEIRDTDRAVASRFPNIRCHEHEIVDIADVAALASRMDRVVTVCTMAAHLAGALGLPAWVMLHDKPYMIWHDHASTSPWYPSLRLFRQRRLGDWGPVIEDVVRALNNGGV